MQLILEAGQRRHVGQGRLVYLEHQDALSGDLTQLEKRFDEFIVGGFEGVRVQEQRSRHTCLIHYPDRLGATEST